MSSVFRIALAVAVTFGCANDTAVQIWGGVVMDSGGIRVVENPTAGLWGEGDRWALEEVLRIGDAAGDPDYQFGHIVGIAVGVGGDVFVLDQQSAQIRVFSADGASQAVIGGPGAGPGEISRGGSTALLNGPGDTLFVADMGNQRVVRFRENGQYAGSFRVDFVTRGIPIQWASLPSGAIAVQLHPFSRPDESPAERFDAIVAMDADGAVLDTLLAVPSSQAFSVRGGRPAMTYFAPGPIWAVTASQTVLYGVNSEYRIGRYAPGGQLIEVFAKRVTPPPVTDEDKRILLEAYTGLMQRQQATPDAVRQFRDEASFAERFPAYRLLHAGPEGSVWVQRVAALSELSAEVFGSQLHAGAPDWDVFDAEGKYLGVVPMPLRFTPLEFIADRIYGVWRDELDVQYVLVLRITGTGED